MVGKIFSVVFAVLVAAAMVVACNESSSLAGPSTNETKPAARLAGLGDCQQMLLAEDGNDQRLTVTVEGGKVSFTHERAVFNCCIDSVALELQQEGTGITVTETEHCSNPCLCTCPRDVTGEIVDLQPGTYTLSVCDTSGTVLCSANDVKVE